MTQSTSPDRGEHIAGFIRSAGWSNAVLQPLAGDASTRRYIRLVDGPRRAMLMDQPRGAEAAACPPEASEAERRRLGYNAMARLAGPDCKPFAAVAAYLRARGLSAPEIFAHDYANGFLLIEDLGEGRFADLIVSGSAEQPLYENAIEVLSHLHQELAPRSLPVPGGADVHLLAYDPVAMEAEVGLLTQWFYPAASGRKVSEDAGAEFLDLWRAALAQVQIDRPVMVLRDYHAENLMWLNQRGGVGRTGLLDFQDALAGSPAYDLISLTEDARRDVSTALADAMTERYIGLRRGLDAQFDVERFRFEAALLAAQRNTKIIGIFARLWKRDGKPRYTQYLPRMWGYLERDLAHPALSGLRKWFDVQIARDWRGTLGQ